MRTLLVFLLVAAGLAACGESGETESSQAAPKPPDRFDSARAWALLERQVKMGPRPAGSKASRKLAAFIHDRLPNASYQSVPGGLRNVIGKVPGREDGNVVLVGAHYDTKEIRGFVGANDGASGTAIALRLAREIKPRTIDPTLLFIFFDGEESPGPGESGDFTKTGLRGSRVAAKRYAGKVDRMVLLDFVGDRRLSIPREGFSDLQMWDELRGAASRAGAIGTFPDMETGGVLDDHTPFVDRGVPAIDLIDFDFPCWHLRCDNLKAVSERSLDRVGETMRELLPRL